MTMLEQGISPVNHENDQSADIYADDDYLSSAEWQDTVGIYFKQIGYFPLLSFEDEKDLAIKMENGGSDGEVAREALIKANTGLAVSIAKRYLDRGVPFSDLIQEGNLGLLRATESYDYRKGFKFDTYATWWVRDHIQTALGSQSEAIPISSRKGKELRKIERVKRDYAQAHDGQIPSEDVVSIETKFSKKKIRRLQRESRPILSLDIEDENSENDSLSEFVADGHQGPEAQVMYGILRELIQSSFSLLSEPQTQVLRLRFGLSEYSKSFTQQEVATMLGLTKSAVANLENRAKKTIRNSANSARLREFLDLSDGVSAFLDVDACDY